MSEQEQYDVLVIGSGEGGKYLAWHMAETGHRTAVIERRWVGGSCPNINCLPSKNEIWSAGIAQAVKNAPEFGVTTGTVAVDRQRSCSASGGWSRDSSLFTSSAMTPAAPS